MADIIDKAQTDINNLFDAVEQSKNVSATLNASCPDLQSVLDVRNSTGSVLACSLRTVPAHRLSSSFQT